MARTRVTAAVRIILMLAGLTVAVLASAQQAPGGSPATPPADTPPSSLEVLWAYQNAFRTAAHLALPVVVKIDVVDVVRQTVQPILNPFSFLFGNRETQAEPQELEFRRPGLGSGVIVRKAGAKVYVLTNEHVVGEADEIRVSLHDGRQFDAAKVGTDSRRDLALIVFETAEHVPIAVLGDSDTVRVGDWAFAVGNPLGFESTVTAGIISAVGRRAAVSRGISGLTDYLQTDASINQGNSGGALVNLAGEVIGINTWIASQSGGSVGLGFAIPINHAKRTIDELIDYGAVEYGWLGVRHGGAITAETAADFGLPDFRGAIIGSVFTGSPAHVSGLLPGDVVRQIGDEVIDDWNELTTIVANMSPGQTPVFRIWRSGRLVTVPVRLERRGSDTEIASVQPWPGFSVVSLTNDMRTSLGLRGEPGSLVVAEVDSGSPAGSAGLRRGDIIRKVNDQDVGTLTAFYQELNRQSDKEVAMRIARQGRELLIGFVR